MNTMLNLSSSPHARDHWSTRFIMHIVALSLLPATVMGVLNYGLRALWVVLAVVGTLLISLEQSDFVTAFTAVLTTLSNVGPGLNGVGPTENFAAFSPAAKLLLSFMMLAGRLEIYPILLLFSAHVWRKN